MGRIYGIDYGRARIGVARSDPMHTLASPHTTIKAGKNNKESIERLLLEIDIDSCEKFIVGLPTHLSGKESEMSQEVRKFCEELEKMTGKPIQFWDERMSSLEADRTMRENNINRKKRAKVIDTLTATILLQSYLDSAFF